MIRLRQVAFVAAELEPALAPLRAAFGPPYRDPNVIVFGLQNAVFAVGDTFLEVVSPVRPGTAAGRHLERRGGDCGYMAIFQLDHLAAARERVAAAGVRVVWQADLDGISGTHLHPADVGGAIVSLDAADPPESWAWAGPEWTGGAPPDAGGRIASLTVEVPDPAGVASRWGSLLGVEALGGRIALDGQEVVFVPGERGIAAVGLSAGGGFEVCGVRLESA